VDSPPQRFSRRILIVDDDASARELIGTLLTHEGYYEVLTASDGFEALAAMRGGIPDLMISDLKMPNMSGFELLSVVRKRFPSIAVIAMSAEFRPASFALDILADRYLRKGETPPLEIVETVRELLEVSPLRSQPARPELAPVWIPRSQTNYIVLTCPDCLRSFSVLQRNLEDGLRRNEACAHCGVTVQYRLDTTSSAELPASGGKRVEAIRRQVQSTRRAITESNRRIDDFKSRSS